MDCFTQHIAAKPGEETFEVLHASETFTIERIASNHLVDGIWYDQDHDEWVMLVRGTASIEFKDGSVSKISAGEYLLLKRHVVHRVKETSEDALWLAVHGVAQ